MNEVEIRPVVKVARDLREIQELHEALMVQAIHKANDREMPGGDAMVALAGVASPSEWEETVAAAEFRHYATCQRLDHTRCHFSPAEDDEGLPPLQVLLFWSEQWREDHGYPLERRPTMASEARFLAWALEWAWENLVEWEDFAKDIRDTKTRMENLVLAGSRTERGVPCLTCNVDLIRPSHSPKRIHACEGHDGVCTIPHRNCPHDRGGTRDEYVCPKCERRYDEESYRRAVAHAHFVSAEWLPLEDASQRTGVKRGTIKVWAHRGHVDRRKDSNSGRTTYRIADIEQKNADPEEAA